MNKTKIEWVKNPDGTQGYTWNPITGCLNHNNGLCKGGNFPCYAYKLANGRLRNRYLANTNTVILRTKVDDEWEIGSCVWGRDPFYPRFWPNRWLDLSWQSERGIFVCDMGELFGDWIPERWQKVVFDYIKCYPNCRFYLLTKQPQNLIKLSPFSDNCWVGVTATDTRLHRLAVDFLREAEAKVKYVSYEPLLNQIDIAPGDMEVFDWVIIGAQTKPTVFPKIEWVEEIVKSADRAGIPVFLKNNLYPLLGLGDGKSICHNNEVGTLRQELPK